MLWGGWGDASSMLHASLGAAGNRHETSPCPITKELLHAAYVCTYVRTYERTRTYVRRTHVRTYVREKETMAHASEEVAERGEREGRQGMVMVSLFVYV